MQAVGLVNNGNMCFFNSMIQFLLTCDEFRNKIAASSGVLPTKLNNIVKRMSQSDQPFTLDELFDAMPEMKETRRGEQGDSAEFLCLLMDLLEKDIPDIYSCFNTRVITTISCTRCGYEETKKDSPELLFDFADDSDMTKQIVRQSVALPDHRCDKCGENDGCLKKSILSMIKQAIIFNIGKNSELSPVSSFEIPIRTANGSKKARYELVASVHHMGTPHAGHYVAMCQRCDKKTYLLDDTAVSLLSDPVTSARHAVLLMYQTAL